MRVALTVTGLAVTALALGLVGCSLLPADPNDPYAIHVDNGTTLPVVVLVNATPVSRVEPGASADLSGNPAGPRPWAVEVRTAGTGRVLLSFEVADGDVDIEGSEQRGVGNRADFSCGRLDVWAGPPMLGPAPAPGVPGDCLP